MAHLKQIKRRLGSVRTTQKMVTAMKLVAGARFRQSQTPLKNAVVYEESYQRMLHCVARDIISQGIDLEDACYFQSSEESHPVEEKATDLILVITSDRGLCGSFHQHIVRAVAHHVATTESAVQFVYWGSKGRQLLQKRFPEHTASWQDDLLTHTQETPAQHLGRLLLNKFQEHTYRRIWIAHGHFISALVQKPAIRLCLPLSCDPVDAPLDSTGAHYDFEPSIRNMVTPLVQRYIEAFLHRLLQESALAEHAARMIAMDQASRNAEKLSQNLALVYNRTRQALITKELIEIIVGAETLSS